MVVSRLLIDRFSVYAAISDKDVIEVWAVMLREPRSFLCSMSHSRLVAIA